MAGTRKQIRLETKMEVFKDIDNGMKQVDVARKYGLAQSTLATFLKKRKEIEESFVGGKFNPSRKRMKTAAADDVDSATLWWFNEMRAQNIAINGPLICQKALHFAKLLGDSNFKASNGWLQRFKDRHGIIFKVISGEEKSAPLGDAEFWRKSTMCKLLEKYSPENLYNADEMGLFYQLMPEKTMAFRGEKCKGGKQSKVRLTVLLCSNASGTHKLTPLVIGRSANPRCFKNVRSLPVNYRANRKAWMTSTLFSEWLLLLDKEMSMKNKKIALLVANCSAHNNMLTLKNVELCYFPPDCTSILQPLDMGIIKNFKTKYRSHFVQHMITNIERKVNNPYSFNVKQACDMIASSWNSVQPNVIVNSWKIARISKSEDVGENVVVDEITLDNIQSDLDIYSAVTGKTIDTSVVEYLSVDDEALVFEACTDESIIEELKGNSSVEDSDSDSDNDSDVINENPPPLMELIGQLETIQQVASSISSVAAQQLIVLQDIKTIFTREYLRKKKQNENK